MKNEDGLGIISIIIIILIITGLITGGVLYINKSLNTEKNEDIKANMLLIQGATRVLKQNSIVQKNTDMFVGTKISEMQDDEIINNFKALNIIEEGQYEKYYCLNNEDLKQLNIEVENEEGSYYLVNYDDDIIIITKGYEGKYKLSEISE